MLSVWDWLVIVTFLAISLGIGLYYSKQASKSMNDFFLGGRNLPWYIAGISMVATTFAADTPLAVTELVAENGISGNWVWWCYLTGGVLTTFFFARLWRRANILTEVEFINIRYSGKAAEYLRGFKAVYLGLVLNCVILAWVNLAMATILSGIFGLEHVESLWVCFGLMILVTLYSGLSGLKGIAITDSIQFFIALAACIVLAVLLLDSQEVGGIAGLKEQLPADTFNFFPSIGDPKDSGMLDNAYNLGIWTFVAFFGFMWWASWYPGAEPGGGGYVAQRMMSAKDEKNAVFATLFFQIGHYCLRPWPWIIVALCALVIYPVENNLPEELSNELANLKSQGIDSKTLTLDEKAFQTRLNESMIDDAQSKLALNAEQATAFNQKLNFAASKDDKIKKAVKFTQDKRFGFVFAMTDYLPKNGMLGLLLVAFLAAYMSTISTQLNWGASYLVNDLYKPFIKPSATEKQLVYSARVLTFLLAIAGFGITFLLDSIAGAWTFIMECGAGLGLVLILRWYWWRINAYSEITATIAPFIGYTLAKYALNLEFPFSFFFTVGFTTVAWLVVTFVTAPTKKETLHAFYQRVKPQGNWHKIANELKEKVDNKSLVYLFLCWLCATSLIYSTLFFMGKIIFQEYPNAIEWLIAMVVSCFVLIWAMRKADFIKR